jgi:hypothetical protein
MKQYFMQNLELRSSRCLRLVRMRASTVKPYHGSSETHCMR